MKELRNGVRISFGIETRACRKGLLLLRDSLIDNYIANQGSLTPDMIADMHEEYAACISMIHLMGDYGYNEHGLNMQETDTWSKERLNAAAVLEYNTEGVSG